MSKIRIGHGVHPLKAELIYNFFGNSPTSLRNKLTKETQQNIHIHP
jgi:hypothetical protein